MVKSKRGKLSRLNGKKGQVAIFVIIAIVLVAVVLAIVFLDVGNVLPNGAEGEVSPETVLSECITPILDESIELLGKSGGYAEPEGYIEYGGEKIKYLCYTSENYQTCAVQQPMIKNHFEKELKKLVEPKMQQCVNGLVNYYEGKGYTVLATDGNSKIKLALGKINIKFDNSFRLTKGEDVQTYDGLDVNINSGMYELLMIATSIIDYEATYGDSETTMYIQYYPDISIDKNKLSDGTTIYTVKDVITGESFRFASRSLVWPAGYGI